MNRLAVAAALLLSAACSGPRAASAGAGTLPPPSSATDAATHGRPAGAPTAPGDASVHAEGGVSVGALARDFGLPDLATECLDESPARWLSHFAGPRAQVPGGPLLLLAFYASWCGPCQKELPELRALDAELGPRGLRTVLVATDAEPEGIAAARRLLAAAKPGFPTLRTCSDHRVRAYLGDGETALPALLLLEPEGRGLCVLHRIAGLDAAAMKALRATLDARLGR